MYDSDEKNAFVCPDGTICVASSIVYEYSFQELFGILSHEMAHFVMEHSLQKNTRIGGRKRNISFGLPWRWRQIVWQVHMSKLMEG